MQLATVVSQIFTGLSLASILLLMSLGLAVIFGLMGVINMAHGELMTAGAYMAFVTQVVASHWFPALQGVAYLFSLPIAFLVSAAMGLAIEWLVVRHLYGRPLETLLATWGISLLLQQGYRNVFGSNNVYVKTPAWLTGGITLGHNLQFPYVRLFILALTAVLLLAVYLYLYRSRQGLQIRAVMQSRNVAASCGVATRHIDRLTFALGSGLAGVAGAALALVGSIGPSTGQHYIVDSFMVVVLGGVGRLIGALVGASVIGEMHATLEYFSSASAASVAVFGLIILFLQARPSGLFPSKSRVLD